MTKIMIPKCRNPFVVIMNGIRYEYESGKEVEVPDEVAAIIQFHVDSKPKALPIVGGGSGPCGLPHVYFSDSANKLPTDAVDGSLAVVESDSIVGEWEWKDNESPLDLSMLNLPTDGITQTAGTINIHGYDNLLGSFGDFSFTMTPDIEIDISTKLIYAGDMFDDSFTTFVLYTDVIDTRSDYFTADDFRAFIKANCNRLSGGHTLYSRENGEWVSKGEVDFTDLAST